MQSIATNRKSEFKYIPRILFLPILLLGVLSANRAFAHFART